jgi:uncharacterized protein with PIN domain
MTHIRVLCPECDTEMEQKYQPKTEERFSQEHTGLTQEFESWLECPKCGHKDKDWMPF